MPNEQINRREDLILQIQQVLLGSKLDISKLCDEILTDVWRSTAAGDRLVVNFHLRSVQNILREKRCEKNLNEEDRNRLHRLKEHLEVVKKTLPSRRPVVDVRSDIAVMDVLSSATQGHFITTQQVCNALRVDSTRPNLIEAMLKELHNSGLLEHASPDKWRLKQPYA